MGDNNPDAIALQRSIHESLIQGQQAEIALVPSPSTSSSTSSEELLVKKNNPDESSSSRTSGRSTLQSTTKST